MGSGFTGAVHTGGSRRARGVSELGIENSPIAIVRRDLESGDPGSFVRL